MGFKKKAKKTYVLKFDDPELEGLVVKMRAVTVEEVLEWIAISGLREELETASRYLIEWNLEEEDGTPVPCTLESLLKQDKEFVAAIITAMLQAAAGVSAPLVPPSTNGGQSLELSIPTEAL